MAKIEIPGMTDEEFKKYQAIFADVVAKYYGDPDFKAKVDSNPADTLRKEGMNIPDGVSVELLFNTDKLMHVVLPNKM